LNGVINKKEINEEKTKMYKALKMKWKSRERKGAKRSNEGELRKRSGEGRSHG